MGKNVTSGDARSTRRVVYFWYLRVSISDRPCVTTGGSVRLICKYMTHCWPNIMLLYLTFYSKKIHNYNNDKNRDVWNDRFFKYFFLQFFFIYYNNSQVLFSRGVMAGLWIHQVIIAVIDKFPGKEESTIKILAFLKLFSKTWFF